MIVNRFAGSIDFANDMPGEKSMDKGRRKFQSKEKRHRQA
jgi:hypothetical protein